MPELPEVETVVRELNRRLKGRRIKSVVITKPKIVHIGPATVSNIRDGSIRKVKKFTKLLTGQKILSVRRRAKLLLFDLSGPLTMMAHLKMTGQFIFEDKKQQKKTKSKYRILNKPTAPLVQLPSKYTHAVFSFTDGSTLYFNDVRQFGYLKLVHDDEIDQVKELKAFGPEPLDKSFTFGKFLERLHVQKEASPSPRLSKLGLRKIKQVLMDPLVVVGIGNIYSDEILFHAKVRPTRIVSSIKYQELRKIYENMGRVLKQAIKYKGSSVGDFVRPDGSWGSMGKHHFVYGRRKLPCLKCGSFIENLKLGGRTASYCPKCQH